MSDTESGTPDARRRKCFHYALELGLTRQDRIEFAETLLWRDVGSWKNLTDDEVGRLLDGFESFLLLSQIAYDGRLRQGASHREH